MMMKKTRIEIEKKIISSVKREMQKPRLTESVRNDGRDQAAPVVGADRRARCEKAGTLCPRVASPCSLPSVGTPDGGSTPAPSQLQRSCAVFVLRMDG